jgi:hypothetical protein
MDDEEYWEYEATYQSEVDEEVGSSCPCGNVCLECLGMSLKDFE